jgi:hypothetical protein
MTSHSHPNEKIKITNGSFSPIARKGLITISKSINLKCVFHVLKLACNLMSMSKLTKDCHHRVIFFFILSVYFTTGARRRWLIGLGWMIGFTTLMTTSSAIKKKIGGFSSISSMSGSEQIMLWHFRLGHPSLLYLKHLFFEFF